MLSPRICLLPLLLLLLDHHQVISSQSAWPKPSSRIISSSIRSISTPLLTSFRSRSGRTTDDVENVPETFKVTQEKDPEGEWIARDDTNSRLWQTLLSSLPDTSAFDQIADTDPKLQLTPLDRNDGLRESEVEGLWEELEQQLQEPIPLAEAEQDVEVDEQQPQQRSQYDYYALPEEVLQNAEQDMYGPFLDWSFSRKSRHDTKKPGPTYFLHDTEEDTSKLESLKRSFLQKSKSILDLLKSPFTSGGQEEDALDLGTREYNNEIGLETIKGNEPPLGGVSSKLSYIRNREQRANGRTPASDWPLVASVASNESDRRLQLLTLASCGIVLALLVSGGLAYVTRRNDNLREKFSRLTFLSDTEATKHYQELCRQRKQEEECSKEKAKKKQTKEEKEKCTAKREPVKSSTSSTSSWNEEPIASNMDISAAHIILSYMEEHLKNSDKMEKEWDALCAYEAESVATHAAQMAQNGKKNRYASVLPYDHSRVILNDLSNASGSDYINASTITDHDPRAPAYIAAQGPLATTVADFWQMVWEQGCATLVMLTRLSEGGVAMCARYWPEQGAAVYHNYEVTLVSEHIWCDDYLVRSFILKNLKTSETRTVTQFHFLSWPENGVPSSPKALLDFRRKVNKSYRGGPRCPIVINCSDGSGRTGTYCLIDMVLNRMAKGVKEIDIAATLEHIRDQRMGMVKSKLAFEFVLTAIAYEIQSILKALNQ